jgi:hypothetical protein
MTMLDFEKPYMQVLSYLDFMIALCIWREARGTSNAARLGVLNVIRNRTKDPRHRWPINELEVILQPHQFSSFNPGDPNATLFPQFSKPGDFKAWSEICDLLMANTPALASAPDPTFGANCYHSIPAGDTLPKWAELDKFTVAIGPFKFYKI